MPEALKDQLRAKALEEGFVGFGVCRPDSVPQLPERLQTYVDKGRHGQMGWMAERMAWRSDPSDLWPEAKSVVMLAEPYTPQHDPLEVLQQADRGAISVYAQNRDYHDIVKKRLKRVGRWLVDQADCEIKVFVDTAPVMEKPLAAAAGLAIAALSLGANAQSLLTGEDELRQKQAQQFQAMFDQPEDLELMFAYALTSIQLKDFEAAISTLDRMLIFNPALVRVRLELAASYFRIGSYPVARHYFTQVIDNPDANDALKGRAKEFLDFLRQIDRKTPKEQDLHLILDNSSTHKTPEVKAWLEKHPRFKLHFTPTSASWLNAVEGWFGQLERRALYRGIFTSVGELKKAIRRFIQTHNEKLAKPFRWHKSAESIMTSVARAKLSVIDNK